MALLKFNFRLVIGFIDLNKMISLLQTNKLCQIHVFISRKSLWRVSNAPQFFNPKVNLQQSCITLTFITWAQQYSGPCWRSQISPSEVIKVKLMETSVTKQYRPLSISCGPLVCSISSAKYECTCVYIYSVHVCTHVRTHMHPSKPAREHTHKL